MQRIDTLPWSVSAIKSIVLALRLSFCSLFTTTDLTADCRCWIVSEIRDNNSTEFVDDLEEQIQSESRSSLQCYALHSTLEESFWLDNADWVWQMTDPGSVAFWAGVGSIEDLKEHTNCGRLESSPGQTWRVPGSDDTRCPFSIVACDFLNNRGCFGGGPRYGIMLNEAMGHQVMVPRIVICGRVEKV